MLGMAGVTLHGIRATYITVGLDDGVAAVDVQKLVGHSYILVTMGYYRNEEQSQRAAKAINRALSLDATVVQMGHESQRLSQRSAPSSPAEQS
jgi:integrase